MHKLERELQELEAYANRVKADAAALKRETARKESKAKAALQRIQQLKIDIKELGL